MKAKHAVEKDTKKQKVAVSRKKTKKVNISLEDDALKYVQIKPYIGRILVLAFNFKTYYVCLVCFVRNSSANLH